MKLEISMARIVFFVVVCAMVVFGGLYYHRTMPIRRAEAQIGQMRMAKEFKILQIELYDLDRELAKIKEESDKKLPTFNLTPADPNKAG